MSDPSEQKEFRVSELFSTYTDIQGMVARDFNDPNLLDVLVGPYMSKLLQQDSWDPLLRTLVELAANLSDPMALLDSQPKR